MRILRESDRLTHLTDLFNRAYGFDQLPPPGIAMDFILIELM